MTMIFTTHDMQDIEKTCNRLVIISEGSKIYDGTLPKGVSKPTAPKIDGTSPNKGWDPTDPDPNNPWNK